MARERMLGSTAALLPAVLGVYLAATGRTGWWAPIGLAVLGFAVVLFMGRKGRHTPWRTAQSQIRPGRAVVFWKPGCMYCERLLRALGDDERLTWVNVWADKQANAEVRRLNGGDEYTPTALVGKQVLRNPSAEELLASLSR